MSSFKVSITLESQLSSQELADFFAALAESERGNPQALVQILHPVAPPPLPVPVEAEEEVVPVPVPVPAPAPEPAVSDTIKQTLMNTEISFQRLNSIIRRHNWARGQKARIERRWGFSKASCFARIGFQFNDYSLMDGSVSTESQLAGWLATRGYTHTL